jgi:hypothetical protein
MTMKGIKLDALSSGVGLAAGLAVGGLCGYYLARRVGQKTFEARVAREVASVKAFYQARTKASSAPGDYGDDGSPAVGGRYRKPGGRSPAAAAQSLADLKRRGIVSSASGPADGGDSVPIPPFDSVPGESPDDAPGQQDPLAGMSGHDGGDGDEADSDDEEDRIASEIPPYDPVPERGTGPYVISTSEFYEDKENYNKISLTYYAADQVLVDEQEHPLNDWAKIAGTSFASSFGEQSEDERIVHIRNERLEADFEIALHEGSYVEVVLGYGATS